MKPAAHQLAMRYAIRASEGLVEAPKASEEAEGAADLAETDAVLITEISTRAQVSNVALMLTVKSSCEIGSVHLKLAIPRYETGGRGSIAQ